MFFFIVAMAWFSINICFRLWDELGCRWKWKIAMVFALLLIFREKSNNCDELRFSCKYSWVIVWILIIRSSNFLWVVKFLFKKWNKSEQFSLNMHDAHSNFKRAWLIDSILLSLILMNDEKNILQVFRSTLNHNRNIKILKLPVLLNNH